MSNLFFKNRDFLQKIELNEIYFFTRRNNKVIAILKDKKIELSTSLYYINELIGKNKLFFRCHKSFIININKIEDISQYTNKTYNIRFKDIKDQAYITQKNLKILKDRILII